MSDRSDDIKQLFSHLGLNPGDYQEVRTVRRPAVDVTSALGSMPVRTETFTPPVAVPQPAAEQAPQAAPAMGPAPAPTLASPLSAAVTAPSVAVPPVTVPLMTAPPVADTPRAPEPTRAPPQLSPASVMTQRREPAVPRTPTPAPATPVPAARAMPSMPSDDTVRRWALLREVQDRPQTLARIQPELREQRRTQQYPAAAVQPPATPAATVPTAPAMPAARPWSFDADLAGMARAQPFQRPAAQAASPAPSEETAAPTMDRLVQAMRRSAVGSGGFDQAPVAAPAPPVAPQVMPAPPAAPVSTGSAGASVLSSTFERLARPQPPVPAAAGGRLRLNIAPDAVAGHSGGPRVESLGEVFSRISSAGPLAPARRS
jgi:hypothetical protein